MTPEATAQQLNTFVSQPINNLIIFLAIVAMAIVLGVVFLVLKFGPGLYDLFKQQSDTNRQNADTAAKLTQIVQQNAEQSQLAFKSVDNNTIEMAKQTAAIEKQTSVIELQRIDQSAYQTLVSDNLSAHSTQVEANTREIAELKKSIDALTGQITEMLNKRDDCADVAGKVDELKEKVDLLLQAPTNAVATVFVDTTPPAGNLIPAGDDSAAAGGTLR